MKNGFAGIDKCLDDGGTCGLGGFCKDCPNLKQDNEIMKLEYDTWYWMAHPHEGDVWFPVFVNSNFEYKLDGKFRPVSELSQLIIKKAVMPLAD